MHSIVRGRDPDAVTCPARLVIDLGQAEPLSAGPGLQRAWQQ
jgi:hypothetical protein